MESSAHSVYILSFSIDFQGLAGGKVIVYPSSHHPADYKAEENIIVGNVCLYGATAGKVLRCS